MSYSRHFLAAGSVTTIATYVVGAAAVTLLCGTHAALAQAFPERPMRIVVAFPPGSSTDIVARLVGPKLSESLGQNVIVENRGGAGGLLGTHVARRAAPDGHTILMNSSAMVVNVSLHANPGYTMADFIPFLQGPTTPNLISVHPSVKANTLPELIALAKAGTMSYASSGVGTTPHLGMEYLLKTLAKVSMTHVPYGPATAVAAVVGNQVPVASTSMPPAVPHVKAGRVRPIAVTTASRSRILPDVPTVAESGFQGFEEHTWLSFFALAGTPAPIVKRLHADASRALQQPDVKERLDTLALEFVPNTPAQFAALVKAEVAKYAAIIKETGIKPD
jgi:tripartite-type tricarboxylate transporter receptor subunit TctC